MNKIKLLKRKPDLLLDFYYSTKEYYNIQGLVQITTRYYNKYIIRTISYI